MGVRLNKYLASCGFGSRRFCESLITEGRVTINGKAIDSLATLVQEGDDVRVGRKKAEPEVPLVLALNKPKGYICSRTDLENRKTVFELLPSRIPRLFYVGRLDMDSEGLLIMTNDGALSQKLGHPSQKVPKVYHVGIQQPFNPEDEERLKRGVYTPEGFGKFEQMKMLNKWLLEVTLMQGLKRQIRNMLHKLDYKVVSLKRVKIGSYMMGNLKVGQTRKLNGRDIALLQKDPRL
ncbi:MAG: pseudouridine synthase [Verrucomicrobiota bacterium]